MSNAATKHGISSIKKAGPAAADWFVFEFKNETPALTINATKENGSTAFECGLSFMLPAIDAILSLHELQSIVKYLHDGNCYRH